MEIELSDIIFTDQDDIVPPPGSEKERIVNTGIVNTLDGNDVIIGNTSGYIAIDLKTGSTLDTGNGNDLINGIGYVGIYINGTLNTGDCDDTITGTTSKGSRPPYDGLYAIIVRGPDSILDTGKGNDLITGSGKSVGITNRGIFNTDDGNDIISGTGARGVQNEGTINTGNGQDSIISQGKFFNIGNVFLGEGNDSITANTNFPTLENFNTLDTGDGNDIITSTGTGIIYNEGIINTGNGDDSIIVDGGVYNNGGSINTGDGNDSIITNGGFQSGLDNLGSVFLGDGKDYIKGYGSGNFYGGNDEDTLELTLGTYTVGIWNTSVIFTQGDQLMITSEFEELLAGGTTYDFASLTAGQIITVA